MSLNRNSYCLFNCDPLVQFTQCMHRFPHPTRNPVFYDAWVSSVGDLLKDKNCLKVYSGKRICDKHFIYSHKISKNRLLPWAVPVYLNHSDSILHLFPNPVKDIERFRTWLYAIGGDILAQKNEEIFNRFQVCHDHFESKYHMASKRLSAIAVPTLHLTGFRQSLVTFVESDHTYTFVPREYPETPPRENAGKTSTEFQPIEVRLQGETHKDHTYDVTDRTTLHFGTERVLEKRINLNSDAKNTQIVAAPEIGTQRILQKCIDLNSDAQDTQIVAAPEIEPLPEVEETFDPDFELQVASSPLPEVEDSGGEAVFSWQREEELIEADEPEEPLAPAADPTLALYCESDPDPNDPKADADPGPDFDPDPDPDIVFEPQPDQAVPSAPAPVDNRCKDCGEVNGGFEFWCVQCAGSALCGACAGRAPHHAHYVLRAPLGCSRARTQAVLAMIRRQLQNQNLLQHGTVDDDLKLEVKEEPSEVPPASSSATEPDPLACESHEPTRLDEPDFSHDLIEPLESVSLRSPISLHSSRSSSRSPHSPTSLPSRSASPPSPLSPRAPASPPSPALFSEPATLEPDKSIAERIVDHHEPLQPPRLRKPTDAHEEILSIPTQRKLVKVSPAEVKRAFLSHIERVVTTQNKQLKVYQPRVKLSPHVRENLVTTQHKGPTYEGNSRTTRLQARAQAPVKVTSVPQPSETVTIDLDVADETVEYLEEGLESDIEMYVDNREDDASDEDDSDDDVRDEDYLLNEDDLEEAELEADDLSDEERIVRNVPGRGVKRKNDAEETSPVKGPSELMVRAFPSKAVIQVRPLSSLEIRNWTAERKRLRKD